MFLKHVTSTINELALVISSGVNQQDLTVERQGQFLPQEEGWVNIILEKRQCLKYDLDILSRCSKTRTQGSF